MKFGWKVFGVISMGIAILGAVAVIILFPDIVHLVDSSPVMTGQRDVSGYDSIYFSGVGELEIVQTGQYSLQISAAENILPDIETTVENKVLRIIYKWDWKKSSLKNQRPVKIQIQVADLTKIDISGAGVVSSPGLKSADLEIFLSGASQAALTVDVESLKSEITGAGQMTLAGLAKSQKINISGAGKYMAGNLTGNNAEIVISGLGVAEVAANNTLDINISGGGKVIYSGNPKIKRQISGLGSIINK